MEQSNIWFDRSNSLLRLRQHGTFPFFFTLPEVK
jgi:hypothetical protein